MSRPRPARHDQSGQPHPDLRDHAPGRIPESLIDAAMDGELNPDIQREVGQALQYDPERRQQLHETRDAINALRIPVEMPDLSDRVLERANRHRRFLPRKLRAYVRAGRMGMAALLLVGLLAVAGLQRMYPRLTTIAAQQTPVHDLETAVERDSSQLAHAVNHEVNTLRTSIAPVAGLFERPITRPGNNDHRFGLDVPTVTSVASMSTDLRRTNNYTTVPAGAGQPGLAVISLINNRAFDARSAAPRVSYGLVSTNPTNHIVYTSWINQSAAPRAEDDRSDRGYEVPDLP
jgi:hypothetical protein